MTVRELVIQIDPQDVPIFYHNDLDHNQIFYTRILSSEELLLFRKSVGKDEPLGVYLLDATIEKSYEQIASKNAVGIETIESLLRSTFPIPQDADMKYLTVLFMVFHEIGHWKHFIQSHLSSVDYWRQYGVPEDDFMKSCYMQQYLLPEISAEVFRVHAREYRKLPMEDAADSYALHEMIPFIKPN